MVDFDPEIIQNAIQLWHKLNTEPEVRIKFTKKDNTTRFITCTLDFKRIPAIDRDKSGRVRCSL